MQLVINVPDDMYELIKSDPKAYYPCGEWIINGTPLPKGHGRLIDVKQIPVEQECVWGVDGYCTTERKYYVNSAPTIVEADKGEQVCC